MHTVSLPSNGLTMLYNSYTYIIIYKHAKGIVEPFYGLAINIVLKVGMHANKCNNYCTKYFTFL